MNDMKKFQFFTNLFEEYFRKYEAHNYVDECKQTAQDEFVFHYMTKKDYASAYNRIIKDNIRKDFDIELVVFDGDISDKL